MRATLIFVLVLIFLPSPVFAQDSNPDGIIGKPSLTILGALQRTSSGEATLFWEGTDYKQDSEFRGFALDATLIYPTTKAISLILGIRLNSQNVDFSETPDLLGQESKLEIYTFQLGIRFFVQ